MLSENSFISQFMETVKKDTEHFTMKDLLYKLKNLTTLYMPLKTELMLFSVA